MNLRAPLLLSSFCILLGCDGDDDDGKKKPSETNDMCLKDPDLTIEGETVPIQDFEFRNAFDPNDQTSYDPDDVASLPGPLMVDSWGDRSTAAHGTLGVFPPGFSAPLHTHSNDYHGVVLRGEMTNPFGTDLERFLDGDPANDHGDVRLGPGSYWYVPAGSQHTTTCVGPEVCWFYFHSEALFDFAPLVDGNGQLNPGVTLEAVPGDAVNLPSGDLQFAGEPDSFVKFASAWGDMSSQAHGTFGRFNAGASSPVHVHSNAYYGVVVSGEVVNPFNLKDADAVLRTGGYWSVPAESVHVTGCASGQDCTFYFHARAGFDFTPTCDQQ